jgi:hypothetical protein
MQIKLLTVASVGLALLAGAALAADTHPVLDKIADKVVQKYKTSSCDQLAAERAHKGTGQREEMEQKLVQLLHEDAQMRQEFLNRVAAPIANKLFECDLIP